MKTPVGDPGLKSIEPQEQVRLTVVLGFLGSGKTTFLLAAARHLVARGQRVAIIVNEAGDVPIDGAVLAATGTRVKEISGGCFCCQLAGDLLPALREIETELHPQWIIMEPSGLADPEQIRQQVETAGVPIRQIAILDLDRIDMLREVLTPMVERSVRLADYILLNKADLASAETIQETLDFVHDLAPDTKIQIGSTQQGVDLGFWEEVWAR